MWKVFPAASWLVSWLRSHVDLVLVDGPSEDPAFAFEGRTAGQAPEIDGVVYLRDAPPAVAQLAPFPRSPGGRGPSRPRAFAPGHFARVRIVEAEGHELVGERA